LCWVIYFPLVSFTNWSNCPAKDISLLTLFLPYFPFSKRIILLLPLVLLPFYCIAHKLITFIVLLVSLINHNQTASSMQILQSSNLFSCIYIFSNQLCNSLAPIAPEIQTKIFMSGKLYLTVNFHYPSKYF